MKETQIEYLSRKIFDLADHVRRQSEEKKLLTQTFNSEIKRRIDCYVAAVKTKNIDLLHDVMDQYEFEQIDGMK